MSGRSSDQIHDLANHTHDLIAEYFAEARQIEVCRLASKGLEEFLEVGAFGGGVGINLDRIDELDFPKPENTSELDALEASIGRWRQVFGEGVAAPDLCECLATLALCQVGDAVHRLYYQYDFQTLEYVRRKAKTVQPNDFILAAQAALSALEAVGRAERLLEARGAITSAGEQEQAVTPPVSSGLGVATEQTLAERGDDARQRSERARQLATLRLANRNATRAAVLAEWDRDPQLQKMSHARAGVRLADWLASQDLERFEPRTIAQWISCCKKTTLQRR
ncbi:MAG: hypothetical protein HT579_03960 [Candidatus Accumulibacter similis]|nr:MAG: hypothetical protein HT579_03960 [Candidatus Accumulibacter similis]